MRVIQLARFRLSQLLEWASDRMENNQISISEALDFYFNWALGRGWALKAVSSAQVRDLEVIFAIDGGDQVVMMRDEIWSVVWESETADGDATFLDEWAREHEARSARFTAAVVELLEDKGWKMDEVKDGHVDPGGTRLISGMQIYAVRGIDPQAAVDKLIAESWVKREEE